jgi:WhiB family redox-sensing transcriptional regulator
LFLRIDTTHAACKGGDITKWFPDFIDDEGDDVFDDGTVFESYGDTDEHYAEAKAICAECPIREECLDYAMEHRIRYGLFGGLTPIERRRIERRDRRKRLQERRRTELSAEVDDTVEDDDLY